MPYVVGTTPRFIRQLQRLPQGLQERVERAMEALSLDPRPPGARPLFATPDMYRLTLTAEVQLVYRVYATVALVEMHRIRYDPL
jgi:hypothetical protein